MRNVTRAVVFLVLVFAGLPASASETLAGARITQCLIAQAEEQPSPPAESADEFQELKNLIEDMSERLARIETRLDNLARKSELASPFEREYTGADLDALAEVEFPENPTRESLRTYVREIGKKSKGQNSFSSTDPQVDMLARVGGEHIDLLLEAASRDSMGGFHATHAAIQVANDDNKQLVLDALLDTPELVDAVVANGWEEDARDILIEGLQTAGRFRYLPETWVQVVAGFDDPETYEPLLHYFVHGQNRFKTYEIISDLPDIDIEPHVEEAWRRARSDHEWERVPTAIVAMQYGNAKALKIVIDHLDSETLQYYRPQMLAAIRRSTPITGSVSDAQEWYEEHKDQLVFDEEERRFEVAE